ncbi:amidohydrolase family protein [Cytobacillus dafuensis]|uniref:Amidohydrolase family protein n=1 Tax=Cytobacillus dafuensis TaxID=1742359 RepID=A0A5B8Z817_CYTDA|nr:amidohydrolase family protein [Cytobacillus dafuensis]QED49108.1 amidohydrolase family protein [Cytobacillus dafuensis]
MLLIKNAKIYTMAGKVIENGDILIENGKIKDIGVGLNDQHEAVINAEGLIATPGLIDAHTHIGVMNFEKDKYSDDANEMTKHSTPSLDIRYSIDLTSKDFRHTYPNGITSVAIIPGSGNVIGGLGVASKTYGANIFNMVIKNPIAMKVALGGNPIGTYGSKGNTPMTRMAVAKLLMDTLTEAKEYFKKKEEYANNPKKLPLYNEEMESFMPVFNKEIQLKVHCTQFDMLTAIEIANKFELKLSIEHAWGAKNFIDEIVQCGCDVVFGPIGVMRSFGECDPIDIESVYELDNRGVNVAIMTDSPILSVDCLIHQAGEAVREGCSVDRALRMITINAAKILGIEDRVGSLKVGKDADIVLFEGMPLFDTNAKVKYTIIDGEIVYKS